MTSAPLVPMPVIFVKSRNFVDIPVPGIFETLRGDPGHT